MPWWYKVAYLATDDPGPGGTPPLVQLEQALNALGDDGWEAFATDRDRGHLGSGLVVFMKTNKDPAKPSGGPNELPLQVLALVPDQATLGEPSFDLHVRGTGFTPDSVILWNGSAEPTTYVSPTELTTGVNMATAQAAITVPVTVQTGTRLAPTVLPFTFVAPARRAPARAGR